MNDIMFRGGRCRRGTASASCRAPSSVLRGLVVGAMVLAGQNAFGFASAGDLGIVRIVGHHFTTRISDGRQVVRVKNPQQSRYLVLKLAIDVPGERASIFPIDFVLQYVRPNGRDGRSTCRAVCRASTSRLGENGTCTTQPIGRLTFGKLQKYMTVAFYLNSNIDKVRIARTGAAPIDYSVGTDRPYSVYLTTNQGTDAVRELEQTIRSGGYQVTSVSSALSSKSRGIVIHHSRKAEAQGREISQRIMTTLGVTPTVKTSKLASDHDVVVWVGQ